jgi:hypothetical protein
MKKTQRLQRSLRSCCNGFAVVLIVVSCTTDANPPTSQESALVGLYVPGSQLGTDALSGEEMEFSSPAEIDGYFAVPGDDRCAGIEAAPTATPGTLTVSFTTLPLNQTWTPDNVGAVWVEDASERYVKTLELWAGIRKKSLYKWGVRACQQSEPDIVTQATLAAHGEHMATWNGKDFKGNVVPDGRYKVFIEVTETELDVGSASTHEFDKGPMPTTVVPGDGEAHQALTITYSPMQ